MDDQGPRLTLYQAEWCPHSHRVRQRLTELGLDVVLRQVPADPADRAELRDATGESSIPVLVFDDGLAVRGDDAIVPELDRRYTPRADADAHRRKLAVEAADWARVNAELLRDAGKPA